MAGGVDGKMSKTTDKKAEIDLIHYAHREQVLIDTIALTFSLAKGSE